MGFLHLAELINPPIPFSNNYKFAILIDSLPHHQTLHSSYSVFLCELFKSKIRNPFLQVQINQQIILNL